MLTHGDLSVTFNWSGGDRAGRQVEGVGIMGRYITVADTAKLVRADLKAAFPSTVFSVRSRKGAIDITYTDGPSSAEVERVAKRYEGATFDGMTDYKGGVVHELNGEHVRFGADFVFVRRQYSLALVGKAVAIVAAKWGPAPCALRVTDSQYFGASVDCNDFHYSRVIGETLSRLNAAGVLVTLKPGATLPGPAVVRTY